MEEEKKKGGGGGGIGWPVDIQGATVSVSNLQQLSVLMVLDESNFDLLAAAYSGSAPIAVDAYLGQLVIDFTLSEARTVAVTAGASAPEYLVEQVVGFLQAQGFDYMEELETVPEDVRFALPSELIPLATENAGMGIRAAL